MTELHHYAQNFVLYIFNNNKSFNSGLRFLKVMMNIWVFAKIWLHHIGNK